MSDRNSAQNRPKLKRTCTKTGWVNRLWYAIEFNDAKTVDSLLSAGANVNHAFQQVRTEQGHRRHRQTGLFIAVRKNYVSLVELLVRSGADVHHVDDRRETALFVAVHRANNKLVRLLVDAGANPDHPNARGETPAHVAVKLGHLTALDYLVKAGCDLSLSTSIVDESRGGGYTPLMMAVVMHADAQNNSQVKTRRRHRHDKETIIERLVAADCSVANMTSQCPVLQDTFGGGWTPLHIAAAMGATHGDFAAAACLLRHGAWPELLTNEGESVIKISMSKPNFSPPPNYFSHNFMRLLVEAGATYYSTSEQWLGSPENETAQELSDIFVKLKQLLHTPRLLSCICVLVIRRALGSYLWGKIDKLSLPTPMKERLKLNHIALEDIRKIEYHA